MKLFEVMNPIKLGIWVAPNGEYVKVATTHVDDIIHNPSKFGITDDTVAQLYKKHNERLGQEGEAREELIKMVLTRGWIRVRNYKNYWSVTVSSLTPKTKENIRNWVHTFVEKEIMGRYADLKILEISNDRLQTVEANDILKFRLEEGVGMNELKIIRETTFSELPDLELLTEVKLARVYQYFTGDIPVGLVTAFRAENGIKLNTQLNKQLASFLRNQGFGFSWVDGAWIENQGTDNEVQASEVSILVSAEKGESEKLFRALVDAAKKYNQDAFVFKSGEDKEIAVYDKNGNPVTSFSRANLDQIGEIYTKLRQGSHRNRSFVFGGERDPVGFMGKLSGNSD